MECFELECGRPVSLPMRGADLGRRKQRFTMAAAGSSRLKMKQRGIFGNKGLIKVLGFFVSKLDWILSGLFSKPIRRWKRVSFNPKPIRRRKGSILDKVLGWASLIVPIAGLGLSGLDSRSVGPDPGSDSRLNGPVFGLVSGSTTCARPVLTEAALVSPMVVKEQVRLEGGRRLVVMVSSSSDASSTVIDAQSHLQEASPVSSMGSVWSDGASDGPVFDFAPDPDSISAFGHAPLPLVVPVPQASDSVLSSRLVSRSATPVESSPFYDPSLGFGLSKLQIWLLERIKDRLKIHEEVKDEDHSTFLKEMEE